jgi:hypothetical protein
MLLLDLKRSQDDLGLSRLADKGDAVPLDTGLLGPRAYGTCCRGVCPPLWESVSHFESTRGLPRCSSAHYACTL